jgi:hypothetical protein
MTIEGVRRLVPLMRRDSTASAILRPDIEVNDRAPERESRARSKIAEPGMMEPNTPPSTQQPGTGAKVDEHKNVRDRLPASLLAALLQPGTGAKVDEHKNVRDRLPASLLAACYFHATTAPKSAESYTACSMLITQNKYGMLSSLLLKLTTHPKAGLRRAYHDIIRTLLESPWDIPYYGTETDRKLGTS